MTGDTPEPAAAEPAAVRKGSKRTGRRRAREAALQALFLLDVQPDTGATAVADHLEEMLRDEELRAFATALVKGVQADRDGLDRLIQQAARNWTIARMPPVDRNILRIGAHELRLGEVPKATAIDEAVEIAKRFADVKSPSFVNGVLDRIARNLKKA